MDRKELIVGGAAVAAGGILSGAAKAAPRSVSTAFGGLDPHFNWVDASGAVSNQVAQIALNTVPYPLAEIAAAGGFLELRNLRERLLRFNDPEKIGYVYLLSSLTGKPIGYHTIKGKVTSTQSQMTETEQITGKDNSYGLTVASIGDDGSWGPEEGGDAGIFFFTTEGVMVETVMPWMYTDAPLPLDFGGPSLNPKGKPSSVSKFWKKR